VTVAETADGMAVSQPAASAWSQLFAPSRVALVGASERNEYWAQLVVNARKLGYRGELVAVNPRAPVLSGKPAAPSLGKAGGIDCAIVNVPAATVDEVVAEGIAAGVRAFVIYSAGFRDVGGAGIEREQLLADRCRAAGAVAVGPNCLGLMSVTHAAPLYGAEIPAGMCPGTVGVISQSGSAVVSLLNNERGINFTHLVSTGNEAVTSVEDVMAHMLGDGRTGVIALVVETLRQPARFRELATRAADQGVAIVALKLGQSTRGAAVSFGHTGAVAGSSEVFRAIFDAENVIAVDDYDEQIETLVALTHGPRCGGRRVAALGFSGGHMSLTADHCARVGLDMAMLSPETSTALRTAIGTDGDCVIENPVDTGIGFAGGVPMRLRYAECVRALKRDPGVDMVVVIQDLQRCLPDSLFTDYADMMDGVADAEDTPGLVVVLTPTAGLFKNGLVHRLRDLTSIPLLQGLRPGLLALRRIADWESRSHSLDTRTEDEPPSDHTRWLAAKQTALRGNRRSGMALSELESKAILAEYGLEISDDVLARSPDAAAEAATRLGFPVVCKIASPDVVHKAAAGGVRLGLGSQDAVRTAYREVVSAARDTAPGSRIDGVLVSRQASGFVELIVGVKRDNLFGPVLVVGVGGSSVEALGLVSTAPLPVGHAEALELLTGFPGAPLLAATGGGPAVDLSPLADVLLAVGQLARDAGLDLLELDLNPVAVRADGTCTVLDAVAVLNKPQAAGGVHR
jgi:acyl-CoA synthetase (NDP forming)